MRWKTICLGWPSDQKQDHFHTLDGKFVVWSDLENQEMQATQKIEPVVCHSSSLEGKQSRKKTRKAMPSRRTASLQNSSSWKNDRQKSSINS